VNKLKALWASLPHQVQAALVVFGTATGVTLAHAIEDGSAPSSWAGVKHLLGTAIVAGVAALRLFYMLPNRSAAPAPTSQTPTPQAPAQP